MKGIFRTARSSVYPDIASILNVIGDDDHQVAAAGLEHLDERWTRYDAAFRRVVGQVDGTTVATGFVCASWGGVSVPGRLWVSIAMRSGRDGASHAIDSEHLTFLRDRVDGPASELWTCMREDHVRPMTSSTAAGSSSASAPGALT